MQFILETQAQTEAILQRLGERDTQIEEQTEVLKASQIRLTEKVIQLADIVQGLAEEHEKYEEGQRRHGEEHKRAEEEYQRARRENEDFHRGVDERFGALINVMDAWIREQRRRNGSNGSA